MAKQVIRLTEGDLHRIIEESVERIIAENMEDEGFLKNFTTGLKTFANAPKAKGGLNLRTRWDAAKKNYATQGEYDDLKGLLTKMRELVNKKQLDPNKTVAQLLGGALNNNKFGTMDGMLANRMGQMKKRGL